MTPSSRGALRSDLLPVNHKAVPDYWSHTSENEAMVSAVNNSQSVLAQSQSQAQAQAQSSASSTGASFQQAVSQYTQNRTAGAGGASGSNPTSTLSSGLMSSLLQMQS